MLEDRLAPASFTVTTTADTGVGSLRAAVDAANAAGGSNTITIAPAIAGQTITLVANDTNNPFAFGPTALAIGTPTTADNLTIMGDPSLGITISGGGTHRIFGVFGVTPSTLTLVDVTLTGGVVQGGRGGGLASQVSTLGGGGGAGLGGAVFVDAGGTLNVVQSTLTGNTATGGAGGVSTVYNGQPRSATGGGGSSAFNGGDAGAGTQGTSGGGGGVAGPGQTNAGTTGGEGGLNQAGVAAPGGGGAGSYGTLGGGGGGSSSGYLPIRGGDGVALSSGGFGGGGGGTWGTNGPGDQGGNGGFGAGGGAGFWGGGNGGFGGGAGAQWGGPAALPGFGGGANGGSASTWGVAGGGGAGMGGAIFNNGGTVTITNSTLTGNTATGGVGGVGYTADGAPGQGLGAAVFNRNGTLTILNSTIALNTATNGGGAAGSGLGDGIYNLADSTSGSPATATLNLANSIISGTAAAGTNDLVNDRFNPVAGTAATVNATTPNLVQRAISTLNGAVTNGSGVVNANPNLAAALANNGGPTQTLALTAASTAAIDRGTNTPGAPFGALPATDQRGFNRIVQGSTSLTVDLGAYEFQPSPTATTTLLVSSSNPSEVGQSVTFTATVSGNVPGSNTPVGAVTFTIDGTPAAPVTLVGGVASFSTSSLTPGTHTVFATYSGGTLGDITFTTSTSPTLTEVVRTHYFAVGADAGALPQVNVYAAATNTLIASFYAFPTFFRGGVRVAVGDVNGDGFDDIVCGAGPGAGPQVTVFDGKTFQPISSFYGMPSFFTGGVFVAAGDLKGDGSVEIIVGADQGAGPQVNVFNGKTGALLSSFYAFPTFFTGGVRVGVTTINGQADIIAGAGPGGLPQVSVFSGANLALLQSFFAFPTFFHGGVFVAGDALADVVVGAGVGGGPEISVFRNGAAVLSFFDPRFASTPDVLGLTPAGVRVGATVVNGRAEILASPGPGVPALVDTFDGTTAALLSSFFAFDPSFRGGVFVGG